MTVVTNLFKKIGSWFFGRGKSTSEILKQFDKIGSQLDLRSASMYSLASKLTDEIADLEANLKEAKDEGLRARKSFDDIKRLMGK